MEATAVVEIGLSRAEFWSLTPRQFDKFFEAFIEREKRNASLLTGRALTNQLAAPADPIAQMRRATETPEEYLARLQAQNPDAQVTMSKAVIDAAATGQGAWSKLGTRDGLMEPASVQAVMMGMRPPQ